MVEKIIEKEVRKRIGRKTRVIVLYTSPTCDLCRIIEPEFKKLSALPQNSNILFLVVDSMQDPDTIDIVVPFISTYKRGALLECGTITGITELNIMLQKLI